jgi:quinol---cytochrome c reductase iron-sulfur subunit, bacillus type
MPGPGAGGDVRRRDLLRSLRVWLAGLLAAAGLPTFRFWLRPGSAASPENWIDAGPLEKLPAGRWIGTVLRLQRPDQWRVDERAVTVYLRRTGGGAEALSAICPHTGCLVRPRDEGFSCPCHESAFGSEGESLAGPAPRSLDRLDTRLERGRVKVRHQLFRTGVADKRPLDL